MRSLATLSAIAFLLHLSVQAPLQAQEVVLRAAVTAGGASPSGTPQLGWSMGQPSSASFASGTELLTAGVQQPEGVLVVLNIRSLLDGPYRAENGLMHDSLRVAGLLPANEPYTGLGFSATPLAAGESLSAGALLEDGPDAIVDWVWIELRDAQDPLWLVANRAALLQRDGDVVAMDGSSALRVTALPGNYHVAVHHRNHLPVMTAQPIALGTTGTVIDLTDGSVAPFGTEALRSRDNRWLQWAGDVNGDGLVKYTGQDNDRDPILQAIGGVVPTAVAAGYNPGDVNLDGRVKYTGQDNDRDPVLQSIGGVVPTSVRTGQLP